MYPLVFECVCLWYPHVGSICSTLVDAKSMKGILVSLSCRKIWWLPKQESPKGCEGSTRQRKEVCCSFQGTSVSNFKMHLVGNPPCVKLFIDLAFNRAWNYR